MNQDKMRRIVTACVSACTVLFVLLFAFLALSPLDAFTCPQLWSGRKVVAGYVRDIINNQITATVV